MIDVNRVKKQYLGKSVLNQVSFAVQPGECFGIIGPNGSGKSTLLRMLSGLENADEGTIHVAGRSIYSYKRRELARWMAVLQQESLQPNGFTVREVVAMGRYPFQNWLGEETKAGGATLIDSVLDCMGLVELADRPVEQLSGGERQRTALAKAMAQQPRVLLMDEPTTYLDIGYQTQWMNLILHWQKNTELTVVAVLHDLNLAAMYCDRLMLLDHGGIVQIGTPNEVITANRIRDVYGTEASVIRHPGYDVPQLLLNLTTGNHQR